MNIEELHKLRERAQRHLALRGVKRKYRVVISMGTSAIAAGAREVMTTVFDELDKRGVDNVEVTISGGSGLIDAEPVICVEDKSGEKVTYAKVNPTGARKIVAEHLVGGKVVDGLAVGKIKEPPRSVSAAGRGEQQDQRSDRHA